MRISIVVAFALAISATSFADPSVGAPAIRDAGQLPFGRFAIKPGWRWERRAEGDDQSGVLLDGNGRVRLNYYMVAFARVGDSCRPRPERRNLRTEKIAGIRVGMCELADPERVCYSFDGRANLCVPKEAPAAAGESQSEAFDALALVRSLRAVR